MSLRDLLPPGAAAQMALEKELELRAAGPGRGGKVYPNSWDLVKRHGVFFEGRALPDEYAALRGQMTHCHVNAVTAAEQAPELRVFTGLYMVAGRVAWHSWCADPDTNLVEVTYPTAYVKGAYDKHTKMPWQPPEHWRYVGLEFDTGFMRQWCEKHEIALLDPTDSEALLPVLDYPYSPKGFPL